MQIRTLPVFSRLARAEQVPDNVVACLPKGWQLSQHQVETYKALTTGDADVIFNTAMTGDGKSLAGHLPTLISGWQHETLAMYPTNELIRDQESQLVGSVERWHSKARFASLNSARLDEIMADEDYIQRGDALLRVIRNNDLVLTNPDIFHLVMQQFYLFPRDARDRLIGPLLQRTRQFTFDEFHIFEIPQVISVLNALLFIHAVSSEVRPHRFLFLSATPGDLLLEYLSRSGLKVQEITGRYAHGAQPAYGNWRSIMQEAQVHFASMPVEQWVELHWEDTLLPFFLDHRPGAKGAIIVNSVATAHRLVERLRFALEPHKLTVQANTGLSSARQRTLSYGADLLVGTSTVDVGVDFQINFLLFESRDAGSFLQRLGRLGRHHGYERDGQFHPFTDFVAYALVPPWVEETLFSGRDGAKPLLEDCGAVDREQLAAAVREAYPPAATYDAYARQWGELQTVRIMMGLSHTTVKQQYSQVRASLGRQYEEIFQIRLRPAYGRYKGLKETQPSLLEEAIAFRGGSYFQCGIIDETEAGVPLSDRLKTVDLFPLLASGEIIPLEESAFSDAVEKAGLHRRVFEREHLVALYVLRGWREERMGFQIMLDRDIRDWGADRFGKALSLRGFKIDGPIPGLLALNKRLSARSIPGLLCLGYSPLELKRRLRLPLLFALYPFESRDRVSGTVAFGREALLLDARLARTRLPTGGSTMIV